MSRENMTIEIEHDQGDDLDIKAIEKALQPLGIRVRGSQPGFHLLANQQLKESYETLGRALRMVGILPYEDV